jgi:microcompartment protein CcmL/EutN
MGAIGMNEIMSIPTGMEACDAMLKAAEVELISAGCVCAENTILSYPVRWQR